MDYEIHVTVRGVDDIPVFRRDCQDAGVKPIIIDLATYQDVMTSSHFVGDDRSVIQEVERISSSLEEKGYNVIRKKVEVPPYHYKVKEEFGEENYLEAHLPIEVLSPLYLERLKEVASKVGAHVSKNAFKPNIYLVTYRSKEALEDFYKSLAWVTRFLHEENFILAGSYQVEFALFDSYVGHDGWAIKEDKIKDFYVIPLFGTAKFNNTDGWVLSAGGRSLPINQMDEISYLEDLAKAERVPEPMVVCINARLSDLRKSTTHPDYEATMLLP